MPQITPSLSLRPPETAGAPAPRAQGAGRLGRISLISLRLVVTGGLLWALADRVDLSRAGAAIAGVSIPLLGLAAASLVLANLVVALRWRLVMRAEIPPPGPATLVKIVWVGLFCNQVLPSIVGGDAVRVWRCRRLGIGLAPAIRSILLDRACGYIALIGLYAVSLPALLRLFPDPAHRDGLAVLFAAALGGLAALMLLDRLPALAVPLRILAPLTALSRAGRQLFSAPRRAAALLGLSAAALVLNILAYQAIGNGLGAAVPFVDWAIVIAPVTLVQLLPISLAGWGVRETALVAALAGFGVPAAAALAVSLLVGLCQIAVALPGSLIWLTGRDVAPPVSPMKAPKM